MKLKAMLIFIFVMTINSYVYCQVNLTFNELKIDSTTFDQYYKKDKISKFVLQFYLTDLVTNTGHVFAYGNGIKGNTRTRLAFQIPEGKLIVTTNQNILVGNQEFSNAKIINLLKELKPGLKFSYFLLTPFIDKNYDVVRYKIKAFFVSTLQSSTSVKTQIMGTLEEETDPSPPAPSALTLHSNMLKTKKNK